MSSKIIMFIVFIFVVGTVVSIIIEGTFIGGGEEIDIMEALTGYSNVDIAAAGGFSIPKLGWGFFTVGLPKVIMWDYSFLDGGWGIFKWFLLYPISAGVVYAIGLLIFNVAQGIMGTIK
jgi:hypothetical protein